MAGDGARLPRWQEQFLCHLTARRCVETAPWAHVARLHASLQAVSANTAQENADLKVQMETLKAELTLAGANYSAAAPAAVTKLQSKLLELQDQVTEHYKQQAEGARARLALSEANQRLKEELQARTAESARLQTLNSNLTETSTRTGRELDVTRGMVDKLKEELVRTRQVLEARTVECDRLRGDSEGVLARVMGEKLKSSEQINSLNALLETTKAERDRLSDMLSTAQGRILELTRALASAAGATSTAPVLQGGSASAVAMAAAAGSSMQTGGARTPAPGAPALGASTSAGAGSESTIQRASSGGSGSAFGGGSSGSGGSSVLSWLGTRVSAVVQAATSTAAAAGGASAAASARATTGAAPGGAAVPAVSAPAAATAHAGGGGGGGGGGFMASSVAGLMGEYVFASTPVPSTAARAWMAHNTDINALKFNESSELLASGSTDGNVGLWDTATGSRAGVLYTSSENNAVMCLDFYGTLVVGGCTDRSLRVWDVHTQRMTRSLIGHSGTVHSVLYVPPATSSTSSMSASASGAPSAHAFSRGLVLSAGADRFVKMWDMRDGRCVRSYDTKSIVNCISLSTDGSLLAVANQDAGVRLYDVRTGSKAVENTSVHTSAVTSVMFSRCDGAARLLTCSRDSTIRVLDGRTLQPCAPFIPPTAVVGHTGVADALAAWSGDSGRSGGDSIVMRHPQFRPAVALSRALFSPNGHHVVAGSASGAVFAWSADNGVFEQQLGVSKDAKSSKSGAAAAAAGSAGAHDSAGDATSTLGASTTGFLKPTAADTEGPHDSCPVLALDWSVDSRFIASGDNSGKIVLWRD